MDDHRLAKVLISRPDATPGRRRAGGPTRAPAVVAAQRPDVHRLLGQLLQHAGLQARHAHAHRQRPAERRRRGPRRPTRSSSAATASTARGTTASSRSPDGTEDWIVYHGNASTSQGCGSTRSTRAQRFTWNADGTPNFGSPVSTSTDLAVPAGERGPITAAVRGRRVHAGQPQHRRAASASPAARPATAPTSRSTAATPTSSRWVLDPTADGYYRLVNQASRKALDVADCGTADGTDVRQWAWLDNTCQQWQVTPTDRRLVPADQPQQRQGARPGRLRHRRRRRTSRLWTWLNNNCQQWRLQPVGTVAVVSVQSGKVLDVANCSTANGTDVRAWTWGNAACQKWTFAHTDNGWYRIQPDVRRRQLPRRCAVRLHGRRCQRRRRAPARRRAASGASSRSPTVRCGSSPGTAARRSTWPTAAWPTGAQHRAVAVAGQHLPALPPAGCLARGSAA